MLEAEIHITLKKTIIDPQGLAIKHALDSLGFKEAGEVRMGKLLTIKLDLKNEDEARQKVEHMCKELLANPIIENYEFEIKRK